MSPQRWEQVKTTLAEALEQPDEKKRAAFLSGACAGDTALLREVESLLSQADDEFDAVAQVIGIVNGDVPISVHVGRRLGAYELVQEIGRGGMGTVWLARRADQQFEKLVAIKLLKRGTNTDEVLRRFHGERQILARLDHPNIGRLLDAGTSDDGLPYFVMEHIEGTRVTDFVREGHLSIARRLELFRKICGAVQFAHQNLVVHRDLKPGNILVTPDGEPKLLDFGIAKLLSPANGEAWETTLAGRERLTPGYASPEQVRGEPVTTVSDVYTLGVLLYELLAERPAHRFGATEPTQSEIVRVICDQEPVRPSAAAVQPEICRQLRGDLDTIVLRAMAKSPHRRYRGAGNLADDLRRYLEGRPVHARPDTFAYRTTRFLGRHRTSVAAAALILIALITGVVTTSYQARVATFERAKAERRFNVVRQVATSLMLEVHNLIKDLPGALAARQLVIQRALEYLDTLSQEAGQDLSLKNELATAYGKIGLVTFDVHQAAKSHLKAATIGEELVKAAPNNGDYRRQLSESYSNLSNVLKIAGHSAESIDYARKSLAVTQSITNSDPKNEEALADRYLLLGLATIDAGDFKQALQSDLKALQIQRDIVARNPINREALRALAEVYGILSNAYEESGDSATALEFGRQATRIAGNFFQSEPSNTRSRRDMWASFFRTGRQLLLTGDPRNALPKFTEATQLIEGLALADPADTGHQRWLAVTHFFVGESLAMLDQRDKALEQYRKAITICAKLVEADPERVEVRTDLAMMDESMGTLLEKAEQTNLALDYLTKAELLAKESAKNDPVNARLQMRLAKIYADLARVHRKLATQLEPASAMSESNLQKARNFYHLSFDLWQDLKKRDMLNALDAARCDELGRELADCDALSHL